MRVFALGPRAALRDAALALLGLAVGRRRAQRFVLAARGTVRLFDQKQCAFDQKSVRL